MASVNKCTIIGNLGKDPEVKYLPSGAAVCAISVATTRSWKNKETGEKQEETEWHRVTFFDKLAEIAGQYLKKGKSVYIEGRLKTRKYTDKDGVEKYTTEIIANEMVMLGGRDAGGGDGDYDQGSAPARQQPQAAQRQQPQRNSAPQQNRAPAQAHRAPAAAHTGGFDDDSDDIPF